MVSRNKEIAMDFETAKVIFGKWAEKMGARDALEALHWSQDDDMVQEMSEEEDTAMGVVYVEVSKLLGW
jgi:hypothetical protein